MAPARSHQDEGSDAPQSGTLSASPTAAATVAGDSTTNGGHGRGNENGNADGRGGAGAGAGDIAQAYKDLTSLGQQIRLSRNKSSSTWRIASLLLDSASALALGPRRCKAEATCVRRTAYVMWRVPPMREVPDVLDHESHIWLDELLAGFETDELRNASSGGKGPAEK
ncbi:hypothetical protein HYQ46_008468 [Verticillium longisporum]|nr:hypothetical protein HYQ46_008468 [Verticillium longisporum]